MVLKSTVSSAKRRNCEFVTWVISFMNNRKRVGPKTEPCGTQEVTGVVVE